MDVLRSIVNEHKIIPRPVHFHEITNHTGKLPECFPRDKRDKSKFRVFDFLDALVTDSGEPAFEGLSLGAGDGLDKAKQAFGVGANHLLRATGGVHGKGMYNLYPPFSKVRET